MKRSTLFLEVLGATIVLAFATTFLAARTSSNTIIPTSSILQKLRSSGYSTIMRLKKREGYYAVYAKGYDKRPAKLIVNSASGQVTKES
jgi:hypothetical protein